MMDFVCHNKRVSFFKHLFLNVHDTLQSSVADYICNNRWSVPQVLRTVYPSLHHKLNLVTIPLIQKEDKLLWKNYHDGNLSFKYAYLFHNTSTTHFSSWATCIWNKAIPPSKSMLMWRILQEKIPTDDQLLKRGCQLSSICNLCNSSMETTNHLFLECSFATQIWNWLRSTLNFNIRVFSLTDPLLVLDKAGSPQCKIVILASIINSFHTINVSDLYDLYVRKHYFSYCFIFHV